MNRRDALKVLALATAIPCSAGEANKKQPLGFAEPIMVGSVLAIQ